MKYALTVTYRTLWQTEMQLFHAMTVAALITVNRLIYLSLHNLNAAVLCTLITTCDAFLYRPKWNLSPLSEEYFMYAAKYEN